MHDIMEMLLKTDAVTSQYNLKGLRHLYDTVESQVRGLKSLGISAEYYGRLYISLSSTEKITTGVSTDCQLTGK